MIVEITLEELLDDYDWSEVFGEGDGGNCDQDVESVDGTPTDVCLRKDVADILAAVNGEDDGEDWIGVFRMKDGRYLAASGGCGYSGWTCQAGNTLTVASTLGALLLYGLTKEQRKRIGAS